MILYKQKWPKTLRHTPKTRISSWVTIQFNSKDLHTHVSPNLTELEDTLLFEIPDFDQLNTLGRKFWILPPQKQNKTKQNENTLFLNFVVYGCLQWYIWMSPFPALCPINQDKNLMFSPYHLVAMCPSIIHLSPGGAQNWFG